MKSKFDLAILKIFLWGLPLVVLVAIGLSLIGRETISENPFADALNSFSGIAIGTWMLFALGLCLRLVSSPSMRAMILPRMLFFKENDERELLLTASATKMSFLSTMAVLILFFCLSVFQISLSQIPPEDAVNGKNKSISLGIGLSLLPESQERLKSVTQSSTDLFRYNGLPVTNLALILFLIVWQVGSYNYFVRFFNENWGKSICKCRLSLLHRTPR